MSACRSNLTPGCSANGLNRVFVLRGFEFGTSPFPFRVEAVDKVLVVVHVLRDGGNGIPVARFRGGYEFCLEFTAEGFFARAVCHELDHLDGVVYVDKMIEDVTEQMMKDSEEGK